MRFKIGPVYICWMPFGGWYFAPGSDYGDFVIWCWRLWIAIDVPCLRAREYPDG